MKNLTAFDAYFFQILIIKPVQGRNCSSPLYQIGLSSVLAGINSWEGVLYYLASLDGQYPNLVVIIGEFLFLVEQLPALPSLVQRFWDSEQNRDSNLKLVLCGSALSMMSDMLAEKNPLHGRASKPMKIEPLSLRDASRFFPNYDDFGMLTMYGIIGGMPYYLAACDPAGDVRSSMMELLLNGSGRLLEEPSNLFASEVREPASYASIVAAISQGCTTSNETAQRVGRGDTRGLSPYLKTLEELDLIEFTTSLNAPAKARDAHVAVKNNLLLFWHRFVLPNLAPIGAGHGDQVCDRMVAPRLSEYIGHAFERIRIEHMKLHAAEHCEVPAREVGQRWGKDYDVDVAGELLDRVPSSASANDTMRRWTSACFRSSSNEPKSRDTDQSSRSNFFSSAMAVSNPIWRRWRILTNVCTWSLQALCCTVWRQNLQP